MAACQGGGTGQGLVAPSDAARWDTQLADAFDDGLTFKRVRMDGRAPNDVMDQRLFQRRLGHADLVVLVRVEQVWGRGRYQGRQEQFIEVSLGETLLGELPRRSAGRQRVVVESAEPLPAVLQGRIMILFLGWAPDHDPPFFHHLMPGDPETIEAIDALVEHAEKAGELGRGKKRRRQRTRRRRRRKRADAS